MALESRESNHFSRPLTMRAEIEEDIFQVVKAKHMHNENHEKIIKKLRIMRLRSTLTLPIWGHLLSYA